VEISLLPALADPAGVVGQRERERGFQRRGRRSVGF